MLFSFSLNLVNVYAPSVTRDALGATY